MQGETDGLAVELSIFSFGIACEVGNCDEEGGVGAHYGVELSNDTPGEDCG